MKINRIHIFGLIFVVGAMIAVLDETHTYYWRLHLFGEALSPDSEDERCRRMYGYRVDGKVVRYAINVARPDEWWKLLYDNNQDFLKLAAESCHNLEVIRLEKKQEWSHGI